MAQKNVKPYNAAGLKDKNHEFGYTNFAGNDNRKERTEILIGNGVRMDLEAFLLLLGFNKGKNGMTLNATSHITKADGRDEKGYLKVVSREPKRELTDKEEEQEK